MTLPEYLLSKLIEECAEVTQRATKAQTFGLNEIQPEPVSDNAERLAVEIDDLEAMLEMLREHNLIRQGNSALRAAKRGRVAEFMKYSQSLGCLVYDGKS